MKVTELWVGYMKQSKRGKGSATKLLFERLKERYHAGNTKEKGRVLFKCVIKFEPVITCSRYFLCRSRDGHSGSSKSANVLTSRLT